MRGEEKEVSDVQSVDNTAPFDAIEKNLRSFHVKWPTSDEMDYVVCGEEHKNDVVKVPE